MKNLKFYFLLSLILICGFFIVQPVEAYYDFKTNCTATKGPAGEGKKWAHFVGMRHNVPSQGAEYSSFDMDGDPINNNVIENCVKVNNDAVSVSFDELVASGLLKNDIGENQVKYAFFEVVGGRISFEDENEYNDTNFLLKRLVNVKDPEPKRIFYMGITDRDNYSFIFFIGFEGQPIEESEAHRARLEDYQCCIDFNGGSDGVNFVPESCSLITDNVTCKEGVQEVKINDAEGAVIGKYKRKREKISCLSNEYCSERLPESIYKKGSITWSGGNDLILNWGESKTFKVTAKMIGSITPVNRIICPACSGKTGLSVVSGGSNGEIELKFDSVEYFANNKDKSIEAGESDFDAYFTLVGEVRGIIDFFKIGFRMQPYNCTQYNLDAQQCNGNAMCFYWPARQKCLMKSDPNVCDLGLPKALCGSNTAGGRKCIWNPEIDKCQSSFRVNKYNDEKPEAGEGKGILPLCAYSGDCDDVNVLVIFLLDQTKKVLGFVGALAFIMFIYGGLLMAFSMGKQEMTEKGTKVIIAAVIGMIIVFAAFLLVRFIFDILGISQDFMGV